MKSEVREVLTEELKDAYSAEKQALRCMQRALRKASAEELREGIQMHIEQTQVQIERVEQAMEKLSVRPGRKVCEAMRGLVEEAQHERARETEKRRREARRHARERLLELLLERVERRDGHCHRLESKCRTALRDRPAGGPLGGIWRDSHPDS